MRKVVYLLAMVVILAGLGISACKPSIPFPSPAAGESTLMPVIPTAISTPNPIFTPTPAALTGTIMVSNPSQLGRNLHDAPNLDAPVVALFLPGDTAQAIARDESGLWVLVSYQGKQLWVFARQVGISTSIDSLPVIIATATPNP